MSCKDLQEFVALYGDAARPQSAAAREAGSELDAHLAACPGCRARLAEFQALQNDLRRLTRPAIPAAALASIRNAVAAELQMPAREKRSYIYSEGFRRWLQFSLMPYAVGTAASIILAVSLLLSLSSTGVSDSSENGLAAEFENLSPSPRSSSVLLASNSNPLIDELAITPSEYAALRFPLGSESPSVNPTGALVALTKSIVRGKMHDDEVVVVADVFGNGVARISEVVEAPRSDTDLQALEKALQQDPNDAAFLPAKFDRRSDVVRVVLKIQHVDVVENSPPRKSRPRNR